MGAGSQPSQPQMSRITRDNHSVPQFYLSGWREHGRKVQAYRTVVPHQSVPCWTLKSVKSLTCYRDLYTTVPYDGREDDWFERWIASNFETSTAPVLEKVRNSQPLITTDWEVLALFATVQDLRTPSAFFEFMQRWERDLPVMMEETTQETLGAITGDETKRCVP